MQLFWDVTYPDTLAPSYLHLTSKVAGKVAEKAEKEMILAYLVYGVGGRSHPLEGALVRLICCWHSGAVHFGHGC